MHFPVFFAISCHKQALRHVLLIEDKLKTVDMKHFSRLCAFMAFLSAAIFSLSAANQKNEIREVKVGDFTGVITSSIIDVELSQGPKKVEVVAPAEYIGKIGVEVVKSRLHISLKENLSKNDGDIRLKVRVSNPSYNYIESSGAADVDILTDLSVNKLFVKLSGSSDLKFKDIGATDLTVNLYGATEVKGSRIGCNKFTLDQSGAAEVAVNTLLAPEVKIKTSGAAEITGNSIECTTFTIQQSGSSELKYKSLNAPEINIQLSGSSEYKVDNVLATTISADLSGSSELKVDSVEATDITVSTSGASEIKLYGKASHVKAGASGASEIDLKGLKCNDVDVTTSGMSEVKR